MDEVFVPRERGESQSAYRGRIRRMKNDAVDALGLKKGDPVWWGGRRTRFYPAIMTRKDLRYQLVKRLEPDDVAILEADEKRRADMIERNNIAEAERNAFYARPDVMAASAVSWILQDDLRKVIDKLTLAEWEALKAKLT